MKLFPVASVRELDRYTIENEPVSSIDLMERAAGEIFRWIIKRYEAPASFFIFAGPGNNGGDGLAVARMLFRSNYKCSVYLVKTNSGNSPEFERNRQRLREETRIRVVDLISIEALPELPENTIVIDAIFGSGLNKPVSGLAAEVIKKINQGSSEVISIDIPSGLHGEDNRLFDPQNIIKADHTLTFQFPKLSFMFPDNEIFTGKWHILPIGLHPEAIEKTESPYRYTELNDLATLLPERKRFAHKGVFGHGLLTGASRGKAGSVILGARAALRSGIGLLTCHVPSSAELPLHTAVPEAMLSIDAGKDVLSSIPDTDPYSAVAFGPGAGTSDSASRALYRLLASCKKPMVIDADGLNLLSANKDWLKLLPENTVLTPHVKEFERLAGTCQGGYERMLRQRELSKEYKIIIVLKGANTSISDPDGRVYFNSTGNPGMATAGSGDVLTGILLALLAQGYGPVNACVLAVGLHGLSGDIAASELSEEALVATDLINCLGKAFTRLKTRELR